MRSSNKIQLSEFLSQMVGKPFLVDGKENILIKYELIHKSAILINTKGCKFVLSDCRFRFYISFDCFMWRNYYKFPFVKQSVLEAIPNFKYRLNLRHLFNVEIVDDIYMSNKEIQLTESFIDRVILIDKKNDIIKKETLKIAKQLNIL